MTKPTKMIPVQNALQAITAKADVGIAVDISFIDDIWEISCSVNGKDIIQTHKNLWYLANLTLLEVRKKIIYPVPHDLHDKRYGKWVEPKFTLRYERYCRCGAIFTQHRGYDETERPYGHRHWKCEAGHIIKETKIYD